MRRASRTPSGCWPRSIWGSQTGLRRSEHCWNPPKAVRRREVERALAEFYLRTADDPKKALPWYDRAVERGADGEGRWIARSARARIVCRLHRDLNDVDRASKDVEELRRDFKDVGRGMLWESEIHARRGDIERAIAALAAYLAVSPDDAYALYQRARYRVSQGAIPAAIEDLQNVKRINPQGAAV